VYLVADWHLNKRLGPAANAFKRGLSQVGAPVEAPAHPFCVLVFELAPAVGLQRLDV
jgi:hypothetical protein